MEDFIFSINATFPIFLLMVLGFFLKQIGWIDQEFASKLNKFVFRIPLPVLLFSQLATTDFRESWDGKFVLYCFLATMGSILLVSLFSLLLKNPAKRGEFIQAAYRSSAALLGIAYIQNIYGSAEMSALMILGSVPLYNIMAVVVLTLTNPTSSSDGHDASALKRTLWGILTNPIILGIAIGFLWSLLRIPLPTIPQKLVSSVASLASPLGLMAMGASIQLKEIKEDLLPAMGAAFFKLLGLCALFLPIAVALGFREQELIAILIMHGSSTTVSSFVMAKNMGHDGSLSADTVLLTTLLSSVSLTFWIYLLRSFALV